MGEFVEVAVVGLLLVLAERGESALTGSLPREPPAACSGLGLLRFFGFETSLFSSSEKDSSL